MRNFIILLSLFSLGFLLSCEQGEKKLKIGYVQITEDPVLNAAKKGFFKALADSGFVDGENIKLIDNNANGDLSMVITILQSLQSQNVDMIVTNSTPCMVAAAQLVRDIPVVFTVAFSPEQVALKSTPLNLYGIYDPYDTKTFVELMKECLPGLKKVGIPYNSSEANAEYSAKMFMAEFEKNGIEVIPTLVNSTNEILTAGQYLTSRNVDAILAAADNTIYLGLNALGKIASENKTPLFVTDPIQAGKGAAIGLGVNYDRWGYLSGAKAVELLKGRNVIKRIEPITEMELIVNKTACKQQGMIVPHSIMDKATKVLE
jgi:putative ABC transport system substrate-binding protein